MKRLSIILAILLIPALVYAYTVGTSPNMVPANWMAYAVDPGASDSGVTSTSQVTLKNLVTDIGTTKKATIIFPHTGSGTTTGYTIATALDLSSYSNITFQIENGAQLRVSDGVSGVTLPSPANIKAQPNQQIVSGTSLYFSTAGTLYPEWFGWNTSNSGTQNTTALNNCYSGVTSVGGTIRFGVPGTYTVNGDSTSTVPSNMTIELSGVTIQLQTTTTNAAYGFLISGKSNVTIRGGVIIGDKVTGGGVATTGSSGIRIVNGSTDVLLEKVECKSFMGDGIYLRGDTGGAGATQLYRITVRDCVIDGNNRNGVSVTGGDGVLFDNCDFNNTSGTNPQAGIDIEPSAGETIENALVQNCRAYGNTRQNFQVNNPLARPLRNVTFDNCTSTSAGRFGIEITNAHGPMKLLNNTVLSTTGDKSIFIQNTASGVTIYDVQVVNNSVDKYIEVSGVTLTGSNKGVIIDQNRAPAGITVSGVTNVSITTNHTNVINLSYDIATDSDVEISDNIVSSDFGVTSNGIYLTNVNKASVTNNRVKGQAYGVYMVSAGDFNVFSGNKIFSTTHSGIAISGNTNVVEDNFIVNANSTNNVNHAGILALDSNFTTISENKIVGVSGKTQDGIWLRVTTSGISNFVLNNQIFDYPTEPIDNDATNTTLSGNIY